MAQTLFDRVFDSHVVDERAGGEVLLYVDRIVLHEITGPDALRQLREKGRVVRHPELAVATQDHIVATHPGRHEASYPPGFRFVRAMREEAEAAGIRLFGLGDPRQGIVHVMAPELGVALPGLTLICGDSHTCTVGALGTLALGVGTSDIAHALATQTVAVRKPKQLRLRFEGALSPWVSAKDLILHAIGALGAGGGRGYAVEYTGGTVDALSIEQRMTLCNMSVELGARVGMIAPDPAAFAYVEGRDFAPRGADWEAALETWRSLRSDPAAVFDAEVELDAAQVAPHVTWGTSPEDAVPVSGCVPDPDAERDPSRRRAAQRALDYIGLAAGTPLEGLPVQRVFIGSCTNARLSDLRCAAQVARGRRVAPGVRALVVPGSSSVKRAAEEEGLDRVFCEAGFEWREAGCSMCCALGEDVVAPGARCVSTSNRNFEGRQGPGSRTHLASPAMAAAAAVTGMITDVRRLMN